MRFRSCSKGYGIRLFNPTPLSWRAACNLVETTTKNGTAGGDWNFFEEGTALVHATLVFHMIKHHILRSTGRGRGSVIANTFILLMLIT
jgi:hypothetical protein